MKTMEEILRTARRDFQNRLRIENPSSPETVAHEIAKNSIPSSSKEILLLAARNLDLALEEATRGPAFDGRSTPINLIASNIREAVFQSLVNPQGSKYSISDAERSTELYQALYARLGTSATPHEVESAYEDLLNQLNTFRETFYTENLYQGRRSTDGNS